MKTNELPKTRVQKMSTNIGLAINEFVIGKRKREKSYSLKIGLQREIITICAKLPKKQLKKITLEINFNNNVFIYELIIK